MIKIHMLCPSVRLCSLSVVLVGGSMTSKDREKLEAVKGVLDCPICLEAMEPPTRIWMCRLSHVICEPCKDRLDGRNCPTCRAEPVTLRAFVFEEVARTAFND